MEETGDLARAVNITYGEKPPKSNEGGEIADEIADIVFTLVYPCNSLHIDMDEAYGEMTENTRCAIQTGIVEPHGLMSVAPLHALRGGGTLP